MYESFYGFRESPFSLLPDPGFLFLSEKHDRALTLLRYALARRAGLAVLSGEIGCGKTTLIRYLLEHAEEDTTFGLVTNTHSSFEDLLSWILMAFGIDYKGKNTIAGSQAFTEFAIAEYARNRHTVLIIDEAQNLNEDTLEELRLLSNINSDKDHVLQIVLAGQPELYAALRAPALVQFRQRVASAYHLKTLDQVETGNYIRHRVHTAGGESSVFGEDCYDPVYRYSGGIPRLINVICDTALVYGYGARQKTIRRELVDEVVRDLMENGLFELPVGDRTARESSREAGSEESANKPRDGALSTPLRPARGTFKG